MNHTEAVRKIADIIESNPGCQLNIDNDYWSITIDGVDDYLCTSNDFNGIFSNWYSHGNHYGALLSDALVELLNRRGIIFTASPV